MAIFNIIYLFCVAVCFNVVLSTEDTADKGTNNIVKPVGRAYSISTCDYKSQVGYSCMTCHRALHCYPGNVAILVDCYGLFRHCRDGRCAWSQGEKCLSETKLSTSSSALNATIANTANVDEINTVATTRLLSEVTKAATETVISIDSKGTTESDASSTNVNDNVV